MSRRRKRRGRRRQFAQDMHIAGLMIALGTALYGYLYPPPVQSLLPAFPTFTEQTVSFGEEDIPGYTGQAYAVVHGNVPYFGEEDLGSGVYAHYSPLDALGRCGAASACVGRELMPTEPRGEIGSVKPSGWHLIKYDIVDGKYLYNRCHLIAYQLTGENANPENLITGTRYLNVQGMLPFENLVADYIRETGNHVLYRVTPVFTGDELVARGVLVEARSIEDREIEYCVYCYNVQPGVSIDYRTGDSRLG